MPEFGVRPNSGTHFKKASNLSESATTQPAQLASCVIILSLYTLQNFLISQIYYNRLSLDTMLNYTSRWSFAYIFKTVYLQCRQSFKTKLRSSSMLYQNIICRKNHPNPLIAVASVTPARVFCKRHRVPPPEQWRMKRRGEECCCCCWSVSG